MRDFAHDLFSFRMQVAGCKHTAPASMSPMRTQVLSELKAGFVRRAARTPTTSGSEALEAGRCQAKWSPGQPRSRACGKLRGSGDGAKVCFYRPLTRELK